MGSKLIRTVIKITSRMYKIDVHITTNFIFAREKHMPFSKPLIYNSNVSAHEINSNYTCLQIKNMTPIRTIPIELSVNIWENLELLTQL